MRRLKLTSKAVEKQRRAGLFGDGGNLYLQVARSGPGGKNISKSWVLRYTLNGRAREMGLGSVANVSLAEARDAARDARKLLAKKIDPIERRNAERAAEVLQRARGIAFAECAQQYIASHRAGWRNAKHAAQWSNTIKTYCNPIIGVLPVADVDTALVHKILQAIWTEKPETASRLRARLERILDFATTAGYRTGENPARWRGNLRDLLPAMKKHTRVRHHPALSHDEIGEFIQGLRAQEGTAARALEFCILTAARTAEVIGAKPDEFDLGKSLWVVPPSRMKSEREHRVALSARAVEIARAQIDQGGAYVFAGAKDDEPLSNGAMLMLLERMGRGDVTVHGFRATFKTWASERTSYAREVPEAAMAHVIPDAVERAYRRGDLFAKRTKLMAAWADFCARPSKAADVVGIKGAA